MGNTVQKVKKDDDEEVPGDESKAPLLRKQSIGPPGESGLRVISYCIDQNPGYNADRRNTLPKVKQWMDEWGYKADVICFQEAYGWHTGLIGRLVCFPTATCWNNCCCCCNMCCSCCYRGIDAYSVVEGRVFWGMLGWFFYDSIKQALIEHGKKLGFEYHAASEYKGKDSTADRFGRLPFGDPGLLILSKKPITESSQVHFPYNNKEIYVMRGALEATIASRQFGKELRVINCHMTPTDDGHNDYEQARMARSKEADILAQCISGYNLEADQPLVVCGSFNIDKDQDSQEIDLLMQKLGVEDVVKQTKPTYVIRQNALMKHALKQEDEERVIDYIFARNLLMRSGQHDDTAIASRHLPVKSDLLYM